MSFILAFDVSKGESYKVLYHDRHCLSEAESPLQSRSVFASYLKKSSHFQKCLKLFLKQQVSTLVH